MVAYSFLEPLTLTKETTTFLGDSVDLFAVLLCGSNVAHFLEHLQCGVDSARARYIQAEF